MPNSSGVDLYPVSDFICSANPQPVFGLTQMSGLSMKPENSLAIFASRTMLLVTTIAAR